MIKKLFFQRLAVILGLFLVCDATKAQVVTFPAPTPPGRTLVAMTINGNATATKFITVRIENTSACPVAVRKIDIFHAASMSFTFGNPPNQTTRNNVSTNGADYTLYTNYSNTTGTPFPMTNWTIAAERKNVTAAANGIINIFSNLDINVNPGTSVRLMIACTDTMIVGSNGALGVTGGGVTAYTGGSEAWIGDITYLTAANFAFSGTYSFEGNIDIDFLAPVVAVDLASKPMTACIGSNVQLRASSSTPNAFFTWRDATGNVIEQNTTGRLNLNNVQLSDAGRYYVTAFSPLPGGCNKESVADSATLVVNDPPAPTISGKFDYCLNEQFEPVTVNGTNPKWYYDPVGGSPVPVTPTISTATPNTLTYYVAQVDGFGCESSQRTMVRFRAAPKPEPPIVNTPVYYCQNAVPDQLTAIGDTLKWYFFPNGGLPTSEAPTPNTSVKDSLEYYVTQTIDGCESDRNRIDVVVTFRPNGMIAIDKDDICAEDSIYVVYFGSADPLSQYNWSLPSPGAVLLSPIDQDTIIVRLDTAGTYEFKLTVGFKGCASQQYTKEVRVRPLPYGKIAAPLDACLGQPILIEAREYTPLTDSFAWDFDGGLTQHFTTEQGPYGVYWSTPGEKYIKVTFTDDGCSDFTMDTVMVHPKPSAKIVASYDTYNNDQKRFVYVDYTEGTEICTSDSLKVTVEVPEPGAKYSWTPARFFDRYTDIPVTYAKVPFNSNIYVEVEDIYGCHNIDSLEVTTKKCCDMFFPTAFTPNGDGKNDRFRPRTLAINEIETFRVVNRYGQVVYESREIYSGWDGTFRGQQSDMGTYFYLISFMCDGEKVDQGGEVILVR